MSTLTVKPRKLSGGSSSVSRSLSVARSARESPYRGSLLCPKGKGTGRVQARNGSDSEHLLQFDISEMGRLHQTSSVISQTGIESFQVEEGGRSHLAQEIAVATTENNES